MSRSGQQTPDGELWDLIVKGDEPAFRALYQRYWQIIYTTAFSYLHDRQACMEIVQDIFVSIWRQRTQLQPGSFHHYLTAAARYQVYRHLQQRLKQRILYREDLQESTGRQPVNEGEFGLQYRELEATLDLHLAGLPDRCREIFYLSRKEQLTIAEIAEKLHISKRTVENQLTRALQHLRAVLNKSG